MVWHNYYLSNHRQSFLRGNKMTKLDKIAEALGVKETQIIIDLILLLEFDLDRMSTSGQETYEKLLAELEIK